MSPVLIVLYNCDVEADRNSATAEMLKIAVALLGEYHF
jgi:hypothetical protein